MFRTGRRHKLTSEAGKRNERGVDPTICEAAADRVAELLATYGGGTIEPGVTVVGHASGAADDHHPDRPARAVTGMDIASHTTIANLEAIGCQVEAAADTLTATVPLWRPDLSDPFDLVEEVARIVGYEDVPSVLPPAPSGWRPDRDPVDAPPRRPDDGRRGLRRGAQLPLRRGGRPRPARARTPADSRRTTLRLANPLSAEEPLMTTTLLPGLLHTVARNVSRGTGDLALFETAAVTLPHSELQSRRSCRSTGGRPTRSGTTSTGPLPDQPLHLAFAVCGDRDRGGWWGDGRPAGWSDVIETAPGRGRRARAWSSSYVRPPGALAPRPLRRAARRRDLGRPRRRAAPDGVPGLRRTRRARRSPSSTSTRCWRARSRRRRRRCSRPTPSPRRTSPSWWPTTCRPRSSPRRCAKAPGRCASRCGSSTSTPVRRSGEGRKSLAFALRFRAPDRTLTEKETAVARAAAVALAEQRHGAQQRS